VGLFGGWSLLAWIVTILGAAGGLLVALSIKYGDAILKTLATTAAIILSSVLDHWFLQGPLTAIMMIAGVQVILSICNYTFDSTPAAESQRSAPSAAVEKETSNKEKDIEIAPVTASSEQSR
jgi:solute carrier family 35 (UDP-sugar transporter), member A1/2/3